MKNNKFKVRSLNFLSLLLAPVILTGCSFQLNNQTAIDTPKEKDAVIESVDIFFPVDGYQNSRTKKVYGQFIKDRFSGYHTGDDVEVVANNDQVQAKAIASGKIVYKRWTSGYGGLLAIRHQIGDTELLALYGHLRLSSINKQINDQVTAGELLGVLGSPNSYDTDYERKHLHFALYKLSDINVSGYVSNTDKLVNWVNPTDFFSEQGLSGVGDGERNYAQDDLNISFTYPGMWAVETIGDSKVVNVFSLIGGSAARLRSQIFISINPSEVKIPDAAVRSVIQNSYEMAVYSEAARELDTAKPLWLTQPHSVAIIKNTESGMVYRLEKNPEVPEDDFFQFIKTINLSE